MNSGFRGKCQEGNILLTASLCTLRSKIFLREVDLATFMEQGRENYKEKKQLNFLIILSCKYLLSSYNELDIDIQQ